MCSDTDRASSLVVGGDTGSVPQPDVNPSCEASLGWQGHMLQRFLVKRRNVPAEVTSLASMSECDIHFFAGAGLLALHSRTLSAISSNSSMPKVMHHFQTIPYCHVSVPKRPLSACVSLVGHVDEDSSSHGLPLW